MKSYFFENLTCGYFLIVFYKSNLFLFLFLENSFLFLYNFSVLKKTLAQTGFVELAAFVTAGPRNSL